MDRVKKSITMNEIGRTLPDKPNDVRVTRMRWLSKPKVDKEHGSAVVFLEEKEQADRLLTTGVVHLPGGR